jgi:hypothetical protein
MKAYINWLKEYSSRYEVDIHAWAKGDTSEYWWSDISGFCPPEVEAWMLTGITFTDE